jgi:hypothetical protein
MEFRNLTPLHAMAFKAVDVARNEFNVVVLKAGYRLERRTTSQRGDLTHDCILMEGHKAISLVMGDEYEADVGTSSVKKESDLAPFKPACDVLIRATAHAPGGVSASSWPVYARLWDGENLVIAKTLKITGPRIMGRSESTWEIGDPEPAHTVPIRWEYSYGGRSLVLPAADSAQPLLNEVCFSNPLGSGWIERRYCDLATRDAVVASAHVKVPPTRHERVDELPAPQIEQWETPITTLDIAEHPAGELDARQMATLARSYAATPAGLGVVGRAWSTRLQRAGTYDDAWLRTRWPHLPEDFDFRYWNGAPDDQQIPWPGSDLTFDLLNLASPEDASSGYVSVRLPGHRALTALRFAGGAIVPLAMNLDTVFIDAEQMQVSLTWRGVFPQKPDVRVCEARFEIDPTAPLLTFANGPTVTEKESVWPTTF